MLKILKRYHDTHPRDQHHSINKLLNIAYVFSHYLLYIRLAYALLTHYIENPPFPTYMIPGRSLLDYLAWTKTIEFRSCDEITPKSAA